MLGVGRTRIDHDVAAERVAYPVSVGAGPCHHTRVGRGEALHIFEQGHRMIGLPIEVVHDLTIGAGQGQFAIRRFVLHVTFFFAGQPACARAAGPQRLVIDRAGIQHGLHVGKGCEALQGSNGGEDDEKVACFVAFERISRAHPHGFELLRFVGHRRLVLGHACHQKRHIKAFGQIAVGDPVGKHINLIGGQFHAQSSALRGKGLAAIELGDVLLGGNALVRAVGQQNAQLFKAFANGRNGLREVQVTLRGSAQGLAM